MVSVNDVYIEHGVIHIVRVSPYQKFKALQHGARACVGRCAVMPVMAPVVSGWLWLCVAQVTRSS